MYPHILQKPFGIPKKQLRVFTQKAIEEKLNLVNQSFSGELFMVDHYRKKIIVGSSHSPVLYGYAKKIIAEEGFEFYKRILKPSEWHWMKSMYAAADKVFFSFPKSQRKHFVVSYDLTTNMINGEAIALRYKIIPFQLCRNGNVWLALCHVTASSSERITHKACCTNTKTGERYEFADGEFVLSKKPIITPQDILILEMMAKGLTDKQMAAVIKGLSFDAFKKRKLRLIKKLDAQTAASAIHEAHILGLI